MFPWVRDGDRERASLVAYCLRITDLDPVKYSLLFERFLNPERISMPDFDIDFCQEKRQSVIEYVTQKYGQANVFANYYVWKNCRRVPRFATSAAFWE